MPDLEKFFERRGLAQPISHDARDYRAGDPVAYRLPGGLPHVGIVAAARTPDRARPLLVHNIGAGAQIEDVLFAYEVAGHYRWGESAAPAPED